MRRGTGKPAELVTRLVDLGAATLVHQCGLTEVQAREAMREIAHNLAREYGGTYMYVPKDQELPMTKRDLAIYEELRSGNVNEVALRHGLSVQQIYAINRHVRELVARKRQAALPGLG
jgi:Mor family transcriptional regulator